MVYKWVAVFIVIILIIMVLVSVFEYTPAREGVPARLGFVWQRKSYCLGKLSTSSKLKDEECELQATISLTDCKNKEWSIIKGVECNETLICGDDVYNQEFEETCDWSENKGSYTFVLCVDGKVKATSSVTC